MSASARRETTWWERLQWIITLSSPQHSVASSPGHHQHNALRTQAKSHAACHVWMGRLCIHRCVACATLQPGDHEQTWMIAPRSQAVHEGRVCRRQRGSTLGSALHRDDACGPW